MRDNFAMISRFKRGHGVCYAKGDDPTLVTRFHTMNTSILKLTGMVPLVLFAATSFAQGDERAVPRASGGSGRSDAGARHSGASSSSSDGGSSASSESGRSSGSSASSASSGSSRDNSARSDASSRRPRPGTGTGTRDRFGNDRDRYRGYPNSYYYYNPYVYSFGYPRSYGRYGYGYGYYDYGYSYGDYYGYYPSYSRSYRYRAGNISQVRTLVQPTKTRVYVDGYYAGVADDFDGILQRLNISPGRHDITFKLEGYNTHTFSIYAGRDQTVKLRWDMARGSGETRDTAGEYEDDRRGDIDSDRSPYPERDLDRDVDRDRESAREGAPRSSERELDRAERPSSPSSRDGRGEVLLEVEPLDASVYVDGEFHGKASEVRKLDLSLGRHRLEIVRPGYRTEETELDVDREDKKVVVKLDRR